MDQSLKYLNEKFQLQEVNLQTYSPLTLAYIGDAAYELVVRTYIVELGNSRPKQMHKTSSLMVRASAQAAMIEGLLPELTDEELQVYKRGRNAKSGTMAKNATMEDYRKATGFECLIGYLYLKGNNTRMTDLIYTGLKQQGFVSDKEEV